MPEERRLRVYTELKVLEVLSRRSDRFSSRVVLPEHRSPKPGIGRDTRPPTILGLSRRDPVNEQIKLLMFLTGLEALWSFLASAMSPLLSVQSLTNFPAAAGLIFVCFFELCYM